MRGRLTDEIQTIALTVLGHRITTEELRLMPYIQYVMMNSQKLDPTKISPHERTVLASWRERGWIEGGASGLAISRAFWDGINAILWRAYVVYDEGG